MDMAVRIPECPEDDNRRREELFQEYNLQPVIGDSKRLRLHVNSHPADPDISHLSYTESQLTPQYIR